MDEQSWWDRRSLSRLDFIKYSLASGVVVWAGLQAPPPLLLVLGPLATALVRAGLLVVRSR